MKSLKLRKMEYCHGRQNILNCLKFYFVYEDASKDEKLVETIKWGDQEAESNLYEFGNIDKIRLYGTKSLSGFFVINKN